jgi:hypothetical protein
MGLFMFTKYAIRIQKAVAYLFVNKPDTTIGFLLLEKALGANYPTPVDSFVEFTHNHVAKNLSDLALPGGQVLQEGINTVLPGEPIGIF